MNAYQEFSAKEKKDLMRMFKLGDRSGDNAWSLKELKQFMANTDEGEELEEFLESFGPDRAGRLRDLWGLVDANGDGSLGFYEVVTLVYLSRLDMTFCYHCEEPIFDDALWACRTCCMRGVEDGVQCDEDWPAVCLSCYELELLEGGSPACRNSPSHALEGAAHDPFVDLTESPLFLELEQAMQRSYSAPAAPPRTAAPAASVTPPSAEGRSSGGSPGVPSAWSFEVALKRLKSGGRPEELTRECEFMRSLPPHEHVVPLYGITTEAATRQPWLVMAWYPLDLHRMFGWQVDGATGPAAEKSVRNLTPSRALDLAWELALICWIGGGGLAANTEVLQGRMEGL
ncbi:hypothetical protein HYH03_012460 [Edaphochlamys debaryana]|uniref:EF-hand domain-containing protein n=1 Tax=Edaphochlamys debaryana TaxID=47281 RepID=A0A835XST9_9CHLO|nr:hypothetical protein HYH03_012460 [Edaphochlamys debaryana]|eukprot:KAG2489022.1 hypothetical protein HYH03_012460 [Edaphochlamys debaryana]